MPGNKKIFVVGAGGQARVVIDILIDSGGYDVIAAVDLQAPQTPKYVFGVPVIGADEAWEYLTEKQTNLGIVAIGDNNIRQLRYNELLDHDFVAETLVHRSAVVAKNAELGDGSCLAPGAIIATDVVIGSNTIINSGAVIEHGSRVDPHVHIAPRAVIAGEVTIGEQAFIGTGAVVKERVCIGKNAVVGAGSVVLDDVPANSVAVGSPARIVRRKADLSEGAL